MSRFGNQTKFNNNNTNKHIMKKIFFVALSATLLAAGCQKTEVLNPVGGASMSFSTSMSKVTKAIGTADAAETGTKNLEAQDFSVWAYADPNGDFSSNGSAVDATTLIYDKMANLHISCTKASIPDNPETEANDPTPGTWVPANNKEYYWPGTGKNLMFFAVSADGNWLRPATPNETRKVTIDLDGPDGGNGTPTMTISNFKVENTPVLDNTDPDNVKVVKTAANEDLMVADYVIQNQDTKKNVDLKFRHTLSKVEFLFKTVKTTGVAVYVQKVEVKNLETTATLNVAYAPTTGIASFNWGDLPLAGSQTLAPFTDDWETSVITTGENADKEFPTKIEGTTPSADDLKAMKITAEGGVDDPAQLFTTWLMIPQSVEGKKVEITYLINERKFTSVFALDASLATKKWAANQYVRYTVTLAPNIIKFVPEVDPWDQYDAVAGNKDDKGNNIYDDITMQN